MHLVASADDDTDPGATVARHRLQLLARDVDQPPAGMGTIPRRRLEREDVVGQERRSPATRCAAIELFPVPEEAMKASARPSSATALAWKSSIPWKVAPEEAPGRRAAAASASERRRQGRPHPAPVGETR